MFTEKYFQILKTANIFQPVSYMFNENHDIAIAMSSSRAPVLGLNILQG